MNFTWFASAYDTDDVPYRVLTLVQIAGVLVLAAGVPAAFDDARLPRGHRRLPHHAGRAWSSQWLRAARRGPGRPARPPCATPWASPSSQVAWLAAAAARRARCAHRRGAGCRVRRAGRRSSSRCPSGPSGPGVPAGIRTTSPSGTALFTIIVLGESVLAASTGIAGALESGSDGPLVLVAAAGLVLLFALWWLYFLEPSAAMGWSIRREPRLRVGLRPLRRLRGARRARRGPGGRRRQAGTHDVLGAGYSVAVPTAAFLALLWVSHSLVVPRSRVRPTTLFGVSALVLLAPVACASAGLGVVVGLIATMATAAVAVTVVGEGLSEALTDRR